MAIRGRKPKPDNEKVTRHALGHEWVDVPDIPYANPEPLGPYPNPTLARPDREHLARCVADRERHRAVLAQAPLIRRGYDLVQNPLVMVVERLTKEIDRLQQRAWEPPTRAWWARISTMPHCVLWNPAQWQYARDTALVYDRWVTGDKQRAGELRQRVAILGTTMGSLRDLRIRYVNPKAFEAPPVETVTEDGEPVDRMADFEAERRRRLLDGQ